MNPQSENHKGIGGQSLTEIDKQSVATSVAKVLTESPDLTQIVEAWPSLPEHIKAAFKALLHTHVKGDQQ